MGGQDLLQGQLVPCWVALTACGFMVSVGWVLFRGADFGIKSKSRPWGFFWKQITFLGTAMRGEGPLVRRRGSWGHDGLGCGYSIPFEPSLKGHHHLIKMSPSWTSAAGLRAGKREEVREYTSPDLASQQAFCGLVAECQPWDWPGSLIGLEREVCSRRQGRWKKGKQIREYSTPRRVMGTLLNGGPSYKDKWYLIKWPHIPSLLPKMSHRMHRVGVELDREPQRRRGASP